MRLITITTSCARALSAACQLVITLAITLLLIAAGPVAASPALPSPSSVAPWSARCYTDTCVGFRVTFASGHAVVVGHSADTPDSWAIRDSTDLTADEASFAEVTVNALEHRDLPSLAATYPDIPSWYLDSLAAYLAPARPVYQRWLPLLMR
jgi:hypothetical protein